MLAEDLAFDSWKTTEKTRDGGFVISSYQEIATY